MIGRIELPIDSSRYIRIPLTLRERFFEEEPSNVICHPIGDSLQLTVENDPVDMILRAEFSEWHQAKPRDRSPNQWCVYANRWEDNLRIVEDEEGSEYVPSVVAFAKVGDLGSEAMLAAQPERTGLTGQEADHVVSEFVRKNGNRTTVKSTDVLKKMGVEKTDRNIKKIHDALDGRFETVRESGSRAKRFRID
jgi:hypothetical protein